MAAQDARAAMCACYQWGRLAERMLYAARAAELATSFPSPNWGAAANHYRDISADNARIPTAFPAFAAYVQVLDMALREAQSILTKLQDASIWRVSAVRREQLADALDEKSALVVKRVEHLVANLKAVCCYQD